MRGKRVALIAGSLAAILLGLIPQGAVADVGNHVMYILGRSTVLGQPCQYVWADSNPSQAGIQADRDQLGIPRPSTLPPTCDKNPNGTIKTCNLRRNLGEYPSIPTSVPPCSGNLSASDSGGCFVATIPGGTCDLVAPTWFYGYCGQTYGGESNGQLTIAGVTWTMDDFGFPRGRGIWEFNGRLTRGTEKGYMRLYLAAAPDQPTQAASCDGIGALSSIYFTGTIITSPTPLPRAFTPQASNPPGGHWNYCDGSGGTDPHYAC